jgi:MFS family permease
VTQGCLAASWVAAAPSGLTFGAALALYGMGMASADVAMNAQAVEVEKRYGRSILASFHGGWNLGGLLGAGLGSLVARWEVAPLPHYVGLCTVLLAALGVAAPRLLPASPEPSRGPVLALPDRAALGPGAMAFCGSLFEALGHHVQRPEDRPAPATAPVTEVP